MSQKELLVKIMKMVVASGVCPETDEKDWAKLILYAHTRGFIYMNANHDTIVCAYRSNKEEHSKEMPLMETGRHLHIVWAVSTAETKNNLLKMLRSFLRENPDIEDISYFRRNSETDFKKINVKGKYE